MIPTCCKKCLNLSVKAPLESSRGWEHDNETKSYWFLVPWITHFLLSSTKIRRIFTQTTFKEKNHLQMIFFVVSYSKLLDGLCWCSYSFLFPLLFVKTFEVVSMQGFHVISKLKLGDIHTLVVVSYSSKSLQQLIKSKRPHCVNVAFHSDDSEQRKNTFPENCGLLRS